MASEYASIDISQDTVPDLATLAEEVHRPNRPRLLRRAEEELAVVMPAPRKRRARGRARPVTEDDALFRSIGSGESTIPGGVSGKKHEYLLRAKRGH